MRKHKKDLKIFLVRTASVGICLWLVSLFIWVPALVGRLAYDLPFGSLWFAWCAGMHTFLWVFAGCATVFVLLWTGSFVLYELRRIAEKIEEKIG